MNSAIVLIVLLLAVPLQLFLTHYINTSYAASATSAPSDVDTDPVKEVKGIEAVRREALHRLDNSW